MDAIAVHQGGFDNAVATLGTALTDEQARLIAQYTSEVGHRLRFRCARPKGHTPRRRHFCQNRREGPGADHDRREGP